MALVDCKEPIYDRQVDLILDGLKEGKSRAELAKELGYNNPVSLDNYMRRHNFSWDSRSNSFVPASERYGKKAQVTQFPSTMTKAGVVIAAFAKGEADSKEIAKKLGFPDHRSMASYMSSKGYVWDGDAGNYISSDNPNPAKLEETPSAVVFPDLSVEDKNSQPQGQQIPTELLQFLPLLQLLDMNKDKLMQLLEASVDSGKIPRYTIPGVHACKTVHMTNTMDQLVKDFSKEKNITQRDLVEVALVEFFRKYGYEKEVEQILGI